MGDRLVAGMKTPRLVLHDVRRRLERTWAETVMTEYGWYGPGTDMGTTTHGQKPPFQEQQETSRTRAWPHAFLLGQPKAEALASAFGDVVGFVHEWRDWTERHGLTLTWRQRRVRGTEQELPTHLLVSDIDTAARITGWHESLEIARTRAGALRDRYPNLQTPNKVLRQVLNYDEVDFDLLCRASDWFASRAAAGSLPPLTPRQVPVEGLHSKWLNTRHALVRSLADVDDLGLLPPHPPRLHFTYIDPDHLAVGGRKHDCITVGDHVKLPYTPRVVIISENKDTAIHFPPMSAGVTVEGSGRGGTTAAAFAWITNADAVFYWGDMDPDGFEILDGFRAVGVPARSLLMKRAEYERWERYGTNVDQHGKPLQPRDPRPTPCLTESERNLYEDLCAPDWKRHRRIEQERIPLHVAADAVRTAIQPLH
jgi:hypothetical protein